MTVKCIHFSIICCFFFCSKAEQRLKFIMKSSIDRVILLWYWCSKFQITFLKSRSMTRHFMFYSVRLCENPVCLRNWNRFYVLCFRRATKYRSIPIVHRIIRTVNFECVFWFMCELKWPNQIYLFRFFFRSMMELWRHFDLIPFQWGITV